MLKYGLIGDPINHSKSPAMQTAALKKANIDGQYTLLNQSGESLLTIVNRLKKSDIQGFNITTPFKNAILPYLDEIDSSAELIQAANTVKVINGRWYGFSTDGLGFWQSLPVDIQPKKVAIIGAGGAAKSIIAATPTGISLQVFNQASPRFNEHKNEIKSLFGIALEELDNIFEQLAQFDVIINATSVGLHDNVSVLRRNVFDNIPLKTLLIDLVYKHHETAFMRYGIDSGHRVIGGLPMLVMQGAISFEIWHQMKADITVMTTALN